MRRLGAHGCHALGPDTAECSVGKSHVADEKKFMLQMARDLGVEDRYLVSEIYSPLRVTESAKRLDLGIAPGFALDLTTVDGNGKAWDFDDVSRRHEAR